MSKRSRRPLRSLPAVILALLILLVSWVPAIAEPRLALVIGNGQYGKEIGSLANPPNDANLMADRLAKLGFKVTKLINGDQKAMKRAISAFGQALSAAGADAVGLFFYAGHGIAVDGTNYLIPVNAAIAAEADVDLEAVSADTVLKQMEYAGTRINIVILDACRNNPLPRSMRSAGRGLARMDAPAGSFIGYSTSPGNVANDGDGSNSPYTAALVSEMTKPGIAIEEAFRNVRVKVMNTTDKQQVPWDSSSLTGAFYFNPGQVLPLMEQGAAQGAAQGTATAETAPVANSTTNAAKELAYWDSIKDSKDAADYTAYLKRFPEGIHADLASDKIARYGGSVNTAGAPIAERSSETAPSPAADSLPPATKTQVAALPPKDSAPELAADGAIQLSAKVSGQLGSYLSQLQDRNGAFAVSPDGKFAGSFICQDVTLCVPGRKGQIENVDRAYPQKMALRKCKNSSKQECVLIMVRDDRKADYLMHK